jgi:hypothetical protein
VDILLTYNVEKLRGPKALVNYFYEKVDLKGSLLVMIIALVVELLFYLIIKAPSFGMISLYTIYSQIIVSWLLTGLVFYLVAYLIKGKSKMPKKAYSKILASLASFRIPIIVYSVFSFAILLIFAPNVLTYLQNIFVNPLLLASTTALPVFTTFNIIGLVILGLSGIGVFIYLLIMFYNFVSKLFRFEKVIVSILVMILLLVVNSFLNFLFLV